MLAEKRGPYQITQALHHAYADEVIGYKTTWEILERQKEDLPEFTNKFWLKIKGILLSGEQPPESPSANGKVSVTGCLWDPIPFTISIATPPIYTRNRKKHKGRYTTQIPVVSDSKNQQNNQ